MEWSSTGTFREYGWHYYFNWANILGGHYYQEIEETRQFSERKITVPAGHGYDEKEYDIKIERVICKFGMKRWFKNTAYRYEVKCDEGVPHPGKGTCAHNCGEDAIYSLTFGAGSIECFDDAAEKFVADALETRKRYPL